MLINIIAVIILTFLYACTGASLRSESIILGLTNTNRSWLFLSVFITLCFSSRYPICCHCARNLHRWTASLVEWPRAYTAFWKHFSWPNEHEKQSCGFVIHISSILINNDVVSLSVSVYQFLFSLILTVITCKYCATTVLKIKRDDNQHNRFSSFSPVIPS
jgi:hypothetical protein